MKTLSRYATALTVILIGAIGAASAYGLFNPPRRWVPTTLPRQVVVDSTGIFTINDVDHGVSQSIIAVERWNGSPVGTLLDAVSAPVSGYVVGDGTSVIYFPGQFDSNPDCTGSCLALTVMSYDPGSETCCGNTDMKTMNDADVIFNTAGQFWCSELEDQNPNDPCSGIEYYVEQVVTHEMGHLLGLAHSSLQTAVMYATSATNENKALTSDDLAGRNFIYTCSFQYGTCQGGGGHGGDCRPFCYE